MGNRGTGPVGLGYRLLSTDLAVRGGLISQHPLGLGSGFDSEAHALMKAMPAPAAIKLVPPALISDAVGFDRFKAAVLARQIEIAISRGGHHYPPVPNGELAAVDGNVEHKMRKKAAAKCDALLAKARADLKAQVLKGVSIGVASAYRPYEHDRKLWNTYFIKYYQATARLRGKLSGGPHGDEAIDRLARYIRGKKAAPGFSNHSNGKAVDFTTRGNKATLGPNTSDPSRAAWRKSWFHKWLAGEKNAAAFGFKPLATEEWHWDFQSDD